jgi:hypothetical protein
LNKVQWQAIIDAKYVFGQATLYPFRGLSSKAPKHAVRRLWSWFPDRLRGRHPSVGLPQHARTIQSLKKRDDIRVDFRGRMTIWNTSDKNVHPSTTSDPAVISKSLHILLNSMLCHRLVPCLGVWSDIYQTSTCRPTYAVA